MNLLVRTTINQNKLFIIPLALTALFIGVFLSLSQTASAYTASRYETNDKSLVDGTVVALTDDGRLKLASGQATAEKYVGVVVQQSDGAVYVADQGVVSVLVSDEKGSIAEGTQIGLADIAGLATVAQSDATAIGVVQAAPSDWRTITLKDENGEQTTTRVANVTVQLVSSRGEAGSGALSAFDSALQSAAAAIAGHTVDRWRVIAAFAVMVSALILSFTLVFVSARQSFLSLGRNPLAGQAIARGLWKAAGLSVVILFAGFISAYALVGLGGHDG